MPRVTPAAADLRIAWTAELGDYVHALAWDPAGERLAAAAADGAVWVAGTGDGIPEVAVRHRGAALGVAWSARGVLASGGEDGRVTFDGRGRDAGGGWIERLAWRPDGGMLAAAQRRRVQLWDPEGGCRHVSPELEATVACLGWHPRGVELAAGTYGGVRILRANGARITERLDWAGSVLELAYSPDGRRLAHGNQDATVHLWDLRRRRELEMSGYETKVRELAWSDDGRWLATGGGPAPAVWDFSGRGPARTRPLELELHGDRVTALAFQPGAQVLASAGRDGLIALWLPGHDDITLATTALGEGVTALAWSPDGRRLAAGAADGTLALLTVAPAA